MKNREKFYENRLKEFREPIMTQEELADRLRKRGYRSTGSYISQIESGTKHVPYGLALVITLEVLGDANRVTEIFLPSSFTGSESVSNPTSAA